MPKSSQNGQAFIGIIVSLGILAILSQVIITLAVTSYDLLIYIDSRTNAKHIANEQLETIHNLPYASIGTVAGIPSGVMPQTKVIQRNGLNYKISTSIVYVDDPFDGIAPTDIAPNDYKRVRVDVSWGGIGESRGDAVTFITDISPAQVESSTGGGTLSILVFNSKGLPLSQANVSIIANSTTPKINLNVSTDTNGSVLLPGAPPCNSCYQITVTKEGYSTDRTYASSEVTNPAKPYQTILKDKLTQISFAIDTTSTLTVISTASRANYFEPLASQQFTLRGNKIIGTDSKGNSVYKYNKTLSTDSSGKLILNDMEWDTYQFANSNTAYDFAGSNPLLPIQLAAGSDLAFSYTLSAHTANSLLTIFTTSAGTPISSVSAMISGGPTTATSSSGLATDPDAGQSFFANLNKITYQIVASAAGYLNYNANIPVSGTTVDKIIMTPQ